MLYFASKWIGERYLGNSVVGAAWILIPASAATHNMHAHNPKQADFSQMWAGAFENNLLARGINWDCFPSAGEDINSIVTRKSQCLVDFISLRLVFLCPEKQDVI